MEFKKVYNLKVFHYKDHDQVRLYSHLVEKKEEIDFDCDTGEIFSAEKTVKKDKIYELTPWGDIVKGEIKDGVTTDSGRSAIVSANRTINEVYSLSRSNEWDYFFTLTFSPDKVDRYDYSECSRKMTAWLNNMRKRYAQDMVYLVVPEMHKDGAFHFHGLFRNIGSIPLVDSGKKDKQGRIIYNIGSYHLGFTTVTVVGDSSRASSYLSKYITKELCAVTHGKKRYWCSRNIERVHTSTYAIEGEYYDRLKMFGKDIDYIKSVDNGFSQVTYIELKGRYNNDYRSNIE